MSGIIQRELEPIDERLPYRQFIELSRKQAESFPLLIEENGVTYEAFDCKMKIEGYMNTSIILYREK